MRIFSFFCFSVDFFHGIFIAFKCMRFGEPMLILSPTIFPFRNEWTNERITFKDSIVAWDMQTERSEVKENMLCIQIVTNIWL